MLEELKKIFGNDILWEPIKEKPNVAFFLAKRDMYRVEIEGFSFVLVCIGSKEDFGVVALKKQKAVYEEQLQCNVAFSFDEMSKCKEIPNKSKNSFYCTIRTDISSIPWNDFK